MNERRTRLGRILRFEDGRQGLVLDLDQVESLVGNLLADGRDGGNALAPEPYLVIEYILVLGAGSRARVR